MQYSECPYFPLGETYYGGRTIDTNDYAAIQMEGREWWFPDAPPGSLLVAGAPRTNRARLMRIVRNVAAIALLPKRLVTFQLTAAKFGARVDGYATTTAAPNAYPVDEYLPAAGVPVGDLFWICLKGPAVCLTDIAAGISIAVGDPVTALTGASSGATTSGHVTPFDYSGATTALAGQILNGIGKALSAVTTGNTNSDVLIDIRPWW